MLTFVKAYAAPSLIVFDKMTDFGARPHTMERVPIDLGAGKAGA